MTSLASHVRRARNLRLKCALSDGTNCPAMKTGPRLRISAVECFGQRHVAFRSQRTLNYGFQSIAFETVCQCFYLIRVKVEKKNNGLIERLALDESPLRNRRHRSDKSFSR